MIINFLFIYFLRLLPLFSASALEDDDDDDDYIIYDRTRQDDVDVGDIIMSMMKGVTTAEFLFGRLLYLSQT